MAQNVIIAGVTYSSVPEVDIPTTGGGTAVFRDTANANVAAGDIRTGKTAYGASGEVQGNLAENSAMSATITAKAQSVTVPSGIHPAGGTVQIASAEQAKLVAGNIKSGVTILGVAGALTAATISQDGSTKVLTIS